MQYLLILIPFIAALFVWLLQKEKHIRTAAFLASTLLFIGCIAESLPILAGLSIPTASDLWFIDRFGALMLLLVGTIQWTAALTGIPYLAHEMKEGVVNRQNFKLYHGMFFLFVLSMILTIMSNNIGITWVAIEGTTLATTMLVAFYTKEGSLEAAWKYIVICSLGIMLGFLGILLVYYAAVEGGVPESAGLTWTTLRNISGNFSPQLMKLAFICIFLLFVTKVGLVPMHTWLPDAHSRSPSPISAMLSGVLLSVALFSIVRFKILTDAAIGTPAWSNHLFFVFGALSFIVPAFFMVRQHNYKRMLAYSSIEHMGFIVFAMSLGPIGFAAALIHLFGHAFAKSLLFYGAGNILLRWKTTKIAHIRGGAHALPFTAGLFFIGLFLLLAAPPSPLFMSELAVIGAAIRPHPVAVTLMLIAAVVIFAGMLANTSAMLLSPRDADTDGQTEKIAQEKFNLSHLAMAIHVLILVGLGLITISGYATPWFHALTTTLQ